MDFDEAWYLKTYPDVAAAVARGGRASGREHFEHIGRERGRFASEMHQNQTRQMLVDGKSKLDEILPSVTTTATTAVAEFSIDIDFYAASYPLATQEIAAGLASNLADHFDRFGRHRGYLGHRASPRSANPANWHSRFGGFWTDQANALDLVSGKLDLKMITAEKATLLRRFVEDGYVVLPCAVPAATLDRAEAALDNAYAGGTPNLQFNIEGYGRKAAWRPDALLRPSKALDLHWLSQPIRDLIFTPQLTALLHLIMERRTFATQSLGFWRGSAQGGHQDSAYVNYSHPMQFLASWIALEDVTENSGELFYYVGSHRMPEYLYLDTFKGIEEAARVTPGAQLGTAIQAHVDQIPQMAHRMGMPKRTFVAKRGDILIWSSDLAHGGSPISVANSRKSVVTHYTTAEAVPSYFELRPDKKRRSHLGEFYSSAHYDFEPPDE